jgi:hypothetical protein
MKKFAKSLHRSLSVLAIALTSAVLLQQANAQDQPNQDDPPSRVARLAYIQGAVSFQPAGQSEWVEVAPNRPLTTGDQIWADRDARAELSLGSAVIDVNRNTGITFLNLDDRTVQVQLSSGSIGVRVRRLDRDDVFEIDTPNQAFSIFRAGLYRIEASDDGTYSVVSIREGEGESTGNGQTYALHSGQQATFEGTDQLDADVEDLGSPDEFDNWVTFRERRYQNSQSARYVSHDVVGYEDLDENGDWSQDPAYGNVWYPHVGPGWAPYREGHWAWIDPWGWTWVEDEPWGYAPFHYGRWLSVQGRWGWVPGPPEVRPVYAPALVVFVGGSPGGNMGWFPLGPREVYVPSYPVSREYVNRVNVSNTTVNVTQVTNVYNTTIINKTTDITNVTYVNKSVTGAVTAVPQQAFTSGQPVARAAVAVNARELAAAPVQSRAAVAPTSNSVLGVHANTANRVAAPPAAVAHRQVVAKAPVPPPPVPFAARQQALAAHPGQPIAKQEMQRLQPANHTVVAQAQVKQAPPGKPATPTMGHPPNKPANAPASPPANRPSAPAAANEHPAASPAQPARPAPNNPAAPNNHPAEPPASSTHPPAAEPNRPQPPQPAPNNHPPTPPANNSHPPAAEPNHPESTQPQPNTRPQPPQHNEPAARPSTPPPSAPQHTPPPAQARPAQPPQHPLTPEEKKKQDEQRKQQEKPN